jgi:putative nucleotidyltransferase with HDIG domain
MRMYSVLFVDDDNAILSSINRWFQSMRDEYELVFANSAEAALGVLAQKQIDVIVTDVRMPGMDGVTLLEIVQKRYPAVVRLILSNQGEKSASLRATRVAHQFIIKPIYPELFKERLARACTLHELLTNPNLQRMVARITSLPSLPSIYLEIVQELASPECSANRVGEIISSDISMCAKVLQLVNSAFFGLPRHVSDAGQATVMLGIETIRDLVLGLNIFSQFDSYKLEKFGLNNLWKHSMAVGACARQIARTITTEKVSVDNAFQAGILHDVGKLILTENLTTDYLNVHRLAKLKGHQLYQAEIEVFGATHDQMGAYLLGLWNFNKEIVNAVAYHNEPSASPMCESPVLIAVHVANAVENSLASKKGNGTPLIDGAYLARLSLDDRIADWTGMCRPAA